MGQKVNANVFRLGYNNNDWNSKYLEQNYDELSLYVYQDIEIKNYINKFFKQHKLFLHYCKIQRSEIGLNIFISYYISLKSLYLINNINLVQKIFLNTTKKNFVKKKKINKRLWILYLLKKKIYIKNDFHKSNDFTEKLLESLSLFTKKVLNINIILQNLNKGLSLKFNYIQLKSLKRNTLKLRTYSKSLFFKECINILSIVIKKKNSAKLLTEFLAFQFSVMKRHNYFLNFLKRALILMLNSKLSSIHGIKLVLKGRLNGKPRAKKKILLIGKVPLHTLDAKINYSSSVGYSQYGTFGIKVWICEK
jgi:small subunit ribosomal protein S3